MAATERPAKQFTIVAQRFNYERYDAQSVALHDDSVRSVFVDSKGWIWVGSATSLAVYDGRQWTNRTFRMAAPLATHAAVRLLGGSTSCGPWHIAEGPRGTIWLGGYFGIWRFRDGRFEELSSSAEVASMVGMGVDHDGGLWVVNKCRVQRHDGKAWTVVLCPYVGKPSNVEASGLYGLAIDTRGSVWIGATVYGEPSGPWEHQGAVWIVDQEGKQQNGGPPMASLFEYDGKVWRAFGAPHGLVLRKHEWAIPELNGYGRIMANTQKGYFAREGETWSPVREVDVAAGKRWVLRKRKDGHFPGYADLLYREGTSLLQVQPTDHKTGDALNLESEQLAALCMAEDQVRGCVWLGTHHGLYRIWPTRQEP